MDYNKEYDSFKAYLTSKGLADKTIKEYTYYYNKLMLMVSELSLSQEVVNEFLLIYNTLNARAFVKNYLTFIKNKDIEIIKRTGRVERKKPVVISQEHINLILQTLYDYNFKFGIMFELIYACALRRNEAVNIKVKDFDWEAWNLNEKGVGRLLLTKTKGRKERYVIVPAVLMETIKEFILGNNLTPESYLFYKFKKVEKQGRYSPEHINLIFNRVCKLLFKKNYKIHSLRHTQTLNWYHNNVNIVRIKERLGHANISTTMLYINPDEEEELKKWEDEVN